MSTESVIRSPKALQRTKNMHQLIAVRMQLDFRRPVAKRTFRLANQGCSNEPPLSFRYVTFYGGGPLSVGESLLYGSNHYKECLIFESQAPRYLKITKLAEGLTNYGRSGRF